MSTLLRERKSDSLKSKTITGVLWSLTDTGAGHLIHFIVGIILARLLSPSEFGLIAMTSIFIAVSQSFVDSGFQQALIRKKDASEIDFSTVFYYNLLIGGVFYLLIFFSANGISYFYKEPQLQSIIRITGLVVLINSFSLIQRAKLTKEINFRLQTKISFTSSALSGIIGIYLAYSGYGVWSLVWRTLLNQLFQTVGLWLFNRWRPTARFSIDSLKEMFSFGSRLLISGLLDTLYQNIYNLLIGKFFSAADLGYYTRADQFQRLPSSNITSAVQRVSYPVLSTLQDDDVKLKEGYRRIVITVTYISFTAMLFLAAISEPMILVLVGEKWLPSVQILQLLCFAGILYPLHAINLNILNVKGRSDLFLRLEVVKKLMAIPVIIVGISISIEALVAGIIFLSVTGYFINSFYSGRLIDYSVRKQIRDILPAFILALVIGTLVVIPAMVFSFRPFITLAIQLLLGFSLLTGISEFFSLQGYLEIKAIITNKIYKGTRKNV